MKITVCSPFIEDVCFELISKAYELKKEADEIELAVISDKIDEENIKKAYMAGANSVVLIKCGEIFNQIAYSKAFIEYFNQNRSDVILFPANLKGRILAPRITTMLDTGLTADCTNIEFIEKNGEIKLASTRPTFGSELMATILSKKKPECATVRKGIFEAKFLNNKEGKFIEYSPNIDNAVDFEIVEKIFKKDNTDYFEDAKVVLAAGFGLYDGKDNIYIKKLKELADKIGAKFAISRKVADFAKEDTIYQIGQTGANISPLVYVAFGISGAMQHITGMKNSKTIIAINTDSNAEIFKYCDYKIVADAKKIIDDMLK